MKFQLNYITWYSNILNYFKLFIYMYVLCQSERNSDNQQRGFLSCRVAVNLTDTPSQKKMFLQDLDLY